MGMGETIKERTLEFIKCKKISVKEFENRCGLSNGYIGAMRKGFGTEKLNNVLTEFPELNRDWLLYGEGQMLIADTKNQPPNDSTILVPVVNLDGRGGYNYNDEVGVTEYQTGQYPFPREIAHEGDVVIPVYGDSMAPAYVSGSLVLIRPVPLWQEYLEMGATYILELEDDRRIIKTVMKGEDAEHYLLVSINPNFQSSEISKKIIRSVWRVIMSVRREAL